MLRTTLKEAEKEGEVQAYCALCLSLMTLKRLPWNIGLTVLHTKNVICFFPRQVWKHRLSYVLICKQFHCIWCS